MYVPNRAPKNSPVLVPKGAGATNVASKMSDLFTVFLGCLRLLQPVFVLRAEVNTLRTETRYTRRSGAVMIPADARDVEVAVRTTFPVSRRHRRE